MNYVLSDGKEQISLIDAVYPIGAIYISVNATSPASFLGGQWAQISAGYALWTATEGAGGFISAGLPNIKGSYSDRGVNISASIVSGAFTKEADNTTQFYTGWTGYDERAKLNFNAADYNSIYGNSSTVQPPAYKVYAWRRTA